jgi:cell division protein FtsZ
MENAGSALMGIGTSNGENRAAEAARIAISSPLLEESVEGATGILLNMTGGKELGLFEVNEAAEIVKEAAAPNANIIFGAVIDEAQGDEVRVTVIATGFDHSRRGVAGGGGVVESTPPPRYGRSPDYGRPPEPPRDRPVPARDRSPYIDDRQRSSLEISDDEIEIPPFLR